MLIRSASAFFLLSCAVQLHTQIVTTIYPVKSILAEVVPQEIHIHNLVPPAASPHTHELLPSDFRISGNSRVLIYCGEGLDKWAEKVPDIGKIPILPHVPDSMRLYPENVKRGSFNPHFWTDPMVIQAMLPVLADTLCAIFPSECLPIRRNAARFADALDSLNRNIHEMLLPLAGTAVLTSHPFFQYFLKRYGFVTAGIIEEIPGKEPTAQVLQRMIKMVKEKNIRAVLTHPQLSDRPARMISESTGIEVIQLDPLGGTNGRLKYADLIKYNAQQLKEALK